MNTPRIERSLFIDRTKYLTEYNEGVGAAIDQYWNDDNSVETWKMIDIGI